MAFASSTTKYYHQFEGEDGATYQWQIRERGFSGTALPLKASSLDHCETSWKMEGKDEYGPVMGSETSISFFDNSVNDVLDDLTSGASFDFNRDYALAITRNGSLQWIGYMETPDVVVDEEGPTRISLTATDGLGRLKNFAYADTDGNPYSGRARLTTIIAELLGPQGARENGVEFGSGFYTACQIYPGTTLTSSDDPLYNIYIDRLGLAASRGSNGDLVAATKLDALKMILSTFGLRISYSEGYYHIYNPHLYHGTSSFSRWEYDSSGAQQNNGDPSSFTHRVTPANETIERTRGTLRQLQQYNGVSVQHSHELAVVFQQPDFTPASSTGPGERGRSDALKWIRGNLTNVKLRPGDGEEDFAGFVATVESTPLPLTTSAITTDVGTNYWRQESLATYRTGNAFDCAWEFKVLPDQGGTSGTASNRDPEFMVALQVRLNATNGDIYYLSFDDAGGTSASWGSANSPAWMVYEADTISSKVGGVVSQKFTTDTMPADGTIEIRLGPVIEAAVRSDSGGTTRRATEGILWDNVQFYAVVGDGEYRNEMTITTNFLEGRRDEENIKIITTQLGDGPNDDSRGSMTYSDDISDRTTDWAVGAHGSPTGKRIDEVICRAVLKSTNLPRRLHQASYETIGSILYPQKSINRSGSSYPALSVSIDWRTQSAEGSWYKTNETSFTDDIVTQIESVPRGSTYRGAGTSMLESSTLTRLTKSFFSDQARRIAKTTQGIPAGSGTASVNVEEMPEPLLNAGDRVVLIAPDLSFYKLEITQDQPAGATQLSFADPESTSDPKDNFDFPREVLSGASIYVYEEDLLTLVRAGEQGFAVTVLGGNIGVINETKNGAHSSLAVDQWSATIRAGSTVEIEQKDGSFVTVELTADAFRGATSISFTLPGEEAATVDIDVETDDRIAPTGSVGRADFTVTADAITSYISTDGDLIATIDTPATSGTSVSTDTPLTSTLKAGDTVYFHGANTGRVFKRTVATVTGSDFTITSAFSGDDIVAIGDYVFGGTIVGMRIDADGVDFVNTHIKSDNWASSGGVIDDDPASATYGEITTNGTEGWVITKSGEAEFANLTVRGTLSSIEGDVTISSTGALKVGTDVTLDSDGLLIQGGSGNINKIRWSDNSEIYSSGGPGVMTINPNTDLAITATSVKVNPGIIRLVSASDAGEAGFTTLYSNSGDLFKRNGTGTDYKVLTAEELPISIAAATKGDILVHNGTNWIDVSVGINGHVLTADSAQPSGVKWAAAATGSYQPLDSDLTAIAALTPTTGQIIFAQSGSWTSLPIGTAGTFLKSSFGTPSWTSIVEADISNLGTNIVLNSDIGSTVQAYSASLTSLAADPLTATTAASTYQPLDSNLTQISAISASNGGLITFAGGSYSQLPAGTDGYFLKMSFGTPSWHPSTDITQVGIISSGTWRGTAIEDTYIGSHTHAASDITSGTFANARISESSVTQHEDALSITESQISDFGSYQPLDADLTDIAGLSKGNGQLLTTTTADGYVLLPAGTNGYILQMSFGTPSWSALSGIDVGDLNDDGTYLDAASGQTITFKDTEFRTVDGGTQTEYQQRTITVTNGQVTSVGSFGSWTPVTVN